MRKLYRKKIPETAVKVPGVPGSKYDISSFGNQREKTSFHPLKIALLPVLEYLSS
jgi:hypothetical protein